MRSLILVAFLPGLAAADPEPEARKTLDDWLEQAAFGRGGYTNKFSWSANAAVAGQAGRDNGVRASGAGEVAWVVGHCKALFLGAAGAYDRKWRNPDSGSEWTESEWSGSAWGGFCVPFPTQKIEMTVRSDYQLRPSFAALPIALRSRYEGTTVSVRSAIVVDDDGPIDHEVFVVDQFTIGMFAQDMLTSSFARGAIDFAAYRWNDTETGRQITAAPAEFRAAGPLDPVEGQSLAWSVTTVGVAPVGLTRWPVGELLGFEIDVDAKVGLAWAGIFQPPTQPMEESKQLHGDVDLFVSTAIHATRGDDELVLTVRRAFEPTMTDRVLLDSRADLTWMHEVGDNNTFVAGAFIARTEQIDRRGVTDAVPTGGTRTAYVQRFGPAQLTLAAEAARSFFAKLDDNLALDAEWAAQTSVTFSVAH